MNTAGDTIAAISSAVGPAARMIVRMSGPKAGAIADALAKTPCDDAVGAAGNRVERSLLHFCDLQVPALAYRFVGPRSVTGEDVVELHIPGNPLLAKLLLEEIVRLGARLAEPGEFTARGFFNGKLDLTEAEGVAATIAAASERELLAARRLIAGELSRRIEPLANVLADTLALVEVGIDFADEDVTVLSAGELLARIARVEEALASLLAESERFERLTHEPRVVLVGAPNAGKSTLLNALAGRARAVVSPHAGTTRDAIWSHVRLRRGIIRLIDVAGLEVNHDGAVDAQMQSKARAEIEQADLILAIRDASNPFRTEIELTPKAPRIELLTKIDLLESKPIASASDPIAVSALSGEGLDDLRRRLDDACFGAPNLAAGAATRIALNNRHVAAVESAREALRRAAESATRSSGAEVIALDLRDALDSLSQIGGGGFTPDDVLGRIFAGFCIGK